MSDLNPENYAEFTTQDGPDCPSVCGDPLDEAYEVVDLPRRTDATGNPLTELLRTLVER